MVINKVFLLGLLTVTTTLFTNTIKVNADEQETYDEAVSMNKLENFWIEGIDVISDLENYDALWIESHSCVWSECGLDTADDAYKGDDRDGDENWYQYRTQDFCANAAYSLYGKKKEEEFFPSFVGCSRRHFINSFFTYGGADNLLKSIGETPVIYSYGDNDNDGDNNNGDDDAVSLSANAACVEMSDDYVISNYNIDDGAENGDDDSNSNSGSNDNGGYSATVGCSSDGKYVFAAFGSSTCDGNYYADIVDNFEEYNEQHDAIGCHKIYTKGDEASVDIVMRLLQNSWSCDLRLYPNGCPDPYRKKEQYDFALRTINQGGNPILAYQNMVLKRPIHIISWVLLSVLGMIIIFTYLVKNESRAIESKGGKNVRGYLLCLIEDIVIQMGYFRAWLVLKWHIFVAWFSKKWNASWLGKKWNYFYARTTKKWNIFAQKVHELRHGPSEYGREISTKKATSEQVDDDVNTSNSGSDSSYVDIDDSVLPHCGVTPARTQGSRIKLADIDNDEAEIAVTVVGIDKRPSGSEENC